MSTDSALQPGLIDRYLPRYTFGHRYDIVVDNGCVDTVYHVARNVDLSRSRVIPWLFRLRGLPTAQLRARAFTQAMGWTDVDEQAPREFLIGYWKTQVIVPVTDARQFEGELQGARQKVAFSFRFRPLETGQVVVETETRVLCIGAAATASFWAYWLAIRPFSGWVRKEVLRLIKQEAEAPPRPASVLPARPKFAMVIQVPAPVLWPMRAYYHATGRLAPRLAVAAFQRMMTGMPHGRLSERDRAFLATGRRLSVPCDGATLVGHEFGQGPTVMLVHGLMGSSANFHAMVPALVARGFRVVAVDFLNHGLSPRGASFSRQTIGQMRQVIASQGRLHALVSHSAGGYLTAMALRELPAGTTVERCIYIAPYPAMEVTLRTFMTYFHVPDRVLPALKDWVGEMTGVPCDEQTLVDCLPRHRTPEPPATLFVHDADDRHIPLASSQDVVARLGGVPLVVTQGLGHFRVLKDPRVLERIAAFLAT